MKKTKSENRRYTVTFVAVDKIKPRPVAHSITTAFRAVRHEFRQAKGTGPESDITHNFGGRYKRFTETILNHQARPDEPI